MTRAGGELGLAFPNGAGRVESLANINNRSWKPFCAALELVDRTGKPLYNFHALRHACASLWIEQGIPAKKIQTWMGHSSIKVTQDLYGHLFASDADDAAIAARIESELLSCSHARTLPTVDFAKVCKAPKTQGLNWQRLRTGDNAKSSHSVFSNVLNYRANGWCPGTELNRRHADFQSAALPTELPGRRTGAGAGL